MWWHLTILDPLSALTALLQSISRLDVSVSAEGQELVVIDVDSSKAETDPGRR